jgi:hypothetical protein
MVNLHSIGELEPNERALVMAAMARYFFNYAPGLPFDEEGEEHKSLDDARLVAYHTAKEMTRGRTAVLADERIVVTDEQGQVVYEAFLQQALSEDLQDDPLSS